MKSTAARRLAFAVPGDLASPTGGYAYDRRIIAELRRLGWQVDVVALGDGFPKPNAEAKALARDILNVTAGTATTDSLVQSMDSQPLSVVVHDLLMSDASLANMIDDVYRATLYRAATPAEIQRLTPQVRAGTTTLDSLAKTLMASSEFFTLASNKIR